MGILKVENGSVDGPGYSNRWRKTDTRGLGQKLMMKWGTNSATNACK
jgi:hypothetical protein